ncbi:natural killer cell receptor 2B4-like [Triplophysa dalaica]|uniref:natural killer cell receptor 2B4-like n=1 Tax=Triplophysa dalaica TaxID=1582913 RepID=UPI0024DF7D32|nr:natural killer cell receptor 2B4-like [Triplophysa dalaica]
MPSTGLLKINLCENISVTAGVFTDEVKSVSVMEGDSVTLHIDLTRIQKSDVIVWNFGSQDSHIAKISREANKVSVYEDVHYGMFRDRLQVDVQTGSLTITNITTQHSGLYHITISGQKKTSYTFNITVYTHLPVPDISSYCPKNSPSSSSSNCSVLCSVMNVTNVSLSWYKGKSLLSSISVSDLNIRLSLPLEVEYQDTNTYRCVINNPITNQTTHLDINQHCQPCSGESHVMFVFIQ